MALKIPRIRPPEVYFNRRALLAGALAAGMRRHAGDRGVRRFGRPHTRNASHIVKTTRNSALPLFIRA